MNFIVYVALSATASVASEEAPHAIFVAPETEQTAQVIIKRETIVRITPVRPAAAPAQTNIPRQMRWKESGGPKCIDAESLAGVLVREKDSIDLVFRGGRQMRAKLEKGCPSVDFYSGFYMKKSKDGRICEDRDVIHSRTGGACEVEKFRSLTAHPGK